MRKQTILLITLCVLCVILLTPTLSFAADQYELLVKDLPYVGQDASGAAYPLALYINRFFQLGLAIAVLLAVVLFVYNGVIYMTSDVVGNKSQAIGNLKGIVGGLLLAFSIFIILEAINPDLVNFQLFQTLGIVKGEIQKPPSGVTPPPNVAWEDAIRASLRATGVGVNAGPCASGGGGSGCTNLYGLPGYVFTRLGTMASQLGGCDPGRWPNCTVVITGGVEPGHQTHAAGKPFVDIRINNAVTNYILQRSDPAVPPKVGSYDYYAFRDENVWALNEGDHWHLCIGIPCEIASGN